MATKRCDEFEVVYRLIYRGRLQSALQRMLDDKNLLKIEFRGDVNHGYYVAGDVFFKKQNYLHAKNAFQRALRSRPHDLQALQALGNCYDKLKRPRMAERVFRKAIEYIDVGGVKCERKLSLALRINLANALFDQHKYAEAEGIYRPLVRAPNEIGLMARKNLKISKSNRLRAELGKEFTVLGRSC